MRLELALQPYTDTPSLAEVLHEMLTDDRVTSIRLVTAWVRSSALPGLREDLARFRARGGRVELTSGLSQGAATRAGLRDSLALVDEAFVVFDGAGRTFHPKVYLARGEAVAMLFIGSQNMTAGGLATNFEAGTRLLLDAPGDPWHLADDVDRYLDRLHGDPAVCRRLDETLLRRLGRDPVVSLADARDEAMLDEALFGTAGGPVRPLPRGGRMLPRRTPARPPWWRRWFRR